MKVVRRIEINGSHLQAHLFVMDNATNPECS